MFLNVLKQRDRIVDRGVIKPANDVARTQPRRGRRRVRLDFVNDRRLRGQNEQLANAFSAPPARLGLVGLYLDRLRLAIALELYRNGLAFTADNRPAHAVV